MSAELAADLVLDLSTSIDKQFCEGLLGVAEAKIMTTSGGKPYLQCTLTDGKVKIGAKKWDFSGELPSGTVKVIGNWDFYGGKPQIMLKRIFASSIQLDLRPTAPLTFEEYKQQYKDAIHNLSFTEAEVAIRDYIWATLCNRQDIPAAKSNHHDYRLGLMEHSLEVAIMASDMARTTGGDEVLAFLGGLSHDIGKILELTWKGNGIEYTDEGHMQGHLVIGVALINAFAKDWVAADMYTLTMQLRHIILSHHGNLEWGSPVQPLFKEACFVHLADMASSQAKYYEKAVPKEEGSNWSARQWPLNRELYVGQ